MKPSPKVFAEAEKFERCVLKAYKCPAGVWTIGLGTTVYPNGKRVQPGDTCTRDQAIIYYLYSMNATASQVDALTVDNVSQGNFDALCLFVYNVGPGAYRDSTLRKKVNANPKDPSIRDEFMKWTKASGEHDGKDNDGDGLIDEPGEKQLLKGLVNRRTCEADLYFS